MTEDKLVELAERCEKAAGPDRELDRLIFAQVCKDAFRGARNEARHYADPKIRLNNADWRFLSDLGMRAVTDSLDAARSIIPEGWHISDLTECGEDNCPHVCLTQNQEPCRDEVGKAPDIIRSLCAAALRARATLTAKDFDQ